MSFSFASEKGCDWMVGLLQSMFDECHRTDMSESDGLLRLDTIMCTLSKVTIMKTSREEVPIVRTCLDRLGGLAIHLLKSFHRDRVSVFIYSEPPFLDLTVLSILAGASVTSWKYVFGLSTWNSSSFNDGRFWSFQSDPIPVPKSYHGGLVTVKLVWPRTHGLEMTKSHLSSTLSSGFWNPGMPQWKVIGSPFFPSVFKFHVLVSGCFCNNVNRTRKRNQIQPKLL